MHTAKNTLTMNASVENVYKHLTSTELMPAWMINLKKVEYVDESKTKAAFHIKQGDKIVKYNGVITNKENESSEVVYNNSQKVFGVHAEMILYVKYTLEAIDSTKSKLSYEMYTKVTSNSSIVNLLLQKVSMFFSKMIIKMQVKKLNKVSSKA